MTRLLILAIFILFLVFLFFDKKVENLRMRGLQGVGALRGEPLGAPECGDQFGVSPWNIGSSCPIRNQRMTIL